MPNTSAKPIVRHDYIIPSATILSANGIFKLNLQSSLPTASHCRQLIPKRPFQECRRQRNTPKHNGPQVALSATDDVIWNEAPPSEEQRRRSSAFIRTTSDEYT